MRYRLTALVFLVSSLGADVRLPALIGDHMLLQRDQPVRLWGWADPNEPVSVRFAGQNVSTTTGADGRWQLWLQPLVASGVSAELVIQAKNTVTIHDVVVGDVWVASGQSNMVWPVERSNNAEQEILNSANAQIRLFQVKLKASEQELDDVEGAWAQCSPESVRNFSAVGFSFARHLNKTQHVPVAIIQSAWGGTPVQSWTSMPVLESNASIRFVLDAWKEVLANHPAAMKKHEAALKDWAKQEAAAKAEGKEPPRKPQPPMGPGHPHQPAVLYNAMIAPLLPYGIRGALWYQGESNAGKRAADYHQQFTAMIRDWRARWGLGDFPFLFVQLANFAKAADPAGWSLVQEAQLKTLEVRRTGMAVIIDVGDSNDIHPTNKQTVGERLALAARHIAHGENIAYSGPRLRQVSREGSTLRLWFDFVGGGLRAKNGDLKGFLVAGPNRRFRPAPARIDGNTILVSAEDVSDPVAVRYAWAADPVASLYNAEGLPAPPFRSDNWPDAFLPN